MVLNYCNLSQVVMLNEVKHLFFNEIDCFRQTLKGYFALIRTLFSSSTEPMKSYIKITLDRK